MKKYLRLSVCSIFLTPVFVLAGPKIFVEEPIHQFGQVPVGSKVEHIFVLENQGDEELVISEVKASCGCTSAVIGEKNLAPGAKTEIKATLDMTMRRGPQTKFITVKSNDIANPNFQVRLAGEGMDDWIIDPMVINVSNLAAGSEHKQTVTIDLRENTSHKVTSVRASRQQVEAVLEEVEPGKKYQIHVTIPPQAKPGVISDSIMIQTDDKNSPMLYCQVVASIQAPITWGPVKLILPAKAENPITTYVTVRAGTQKEFKVLSATFADGAVKGEIQPPTRFGQQIRFSSITPSKDWNGKNIVITTDVPGFETIEIPVEVN